MVKFKYSKSTAYFWGLYFGFSISTRREGNYATGRDWKLRVVAGFFFILLFLRFILSPFFFTKGVTSMHNNKFKIKFFNKVKKDTSRPYLTNFLSFHFFFCKEFLSIIIFYLDSKKKKKLVQDTCGNLERKKIHPNSTPLRLVLQWKWKTLF